MKRFLGLTLAAAIGLFYAGAAQALPVPGVANGTFTTADYPAGSAANGIVGSRHNLGAFGSFLTTSGQNGTTEICVFCHTPHHTDTTVSPAPLWNRKNAAGAYTAYGTTIGGSSITSVGSVSLACLSCHDGVTTFDNLINAPGAGGVNSAGASQNWTFMLNGNAAGAFSSMPAFVNGAGDQRLNIGADLSNDHPMSVTYVADRASLRPTNTVINSINLTAGLQGSAATAFGGNMTQNRWAIKGYISDTATIADLLRNGRVECSSCHDPHFKNLSWDEVDGKGAYTGIDPSEVDGLFLRRVGGNTGSGVCRTCHNK